MVWSDSVVGVQPETRVAAHDIALSLTPTVVDDESERDAKSDRRGNGLALIVDHTNCFCPHTAT